MGPCYMWFNAIIAFVQISESAQQSTNDELATSMNFLFYAEKVVQIFRFEGIDQIPMKHVEMNSVFFIGG